MVNFLKCLFTAILVTMLTTSNISFWYNVLIPAFIAGTSIGLLISYREEKYFYVTLVLGLFIFWCPGLTVSKMITIVENIYNHSETKQVTSNYIPKASSEDATEITICDKGECFTTSSAESVDELLTVIKEKNEHDMSCKNGKRIDCI